MAVTYSSTPWGKIPTVDYYADLPSVTEYVGRICLVLNPSGIWLINYHEAGVYYSDGITWEKKSDTIDTVVNNVTLTDINGVLYGNGSKVLGDTAFSYSAQTLSVPKAKIGDIPNGDYTEVEADGTVVFKGDATVYNDLPPIPLLSQRVGSANNPSLASFLGNIFQLTFSSGDYVYFNYEITHEYEEGSDLEIHVHWSNNGVDIDNRYVNWEVEYTIANLASQAPFTQFPAPQVVPSGDMLIPANTVTKCHFYSMIGLIAGAGLKIGAYIVGRFRRIAAVGTAPSNNPFAFTCGFHIKHDTCGSRQTGIK